MASEFCLTTLMSAGGFKTLTPAEQAARLTQFMVEWFEFHPLDTIDLIRHTQRLNTHAAATGVCAGDLLLGLLQEAKVLHAQRAACGSQRPGLLDVEVDQATYQGEDQSGTTRLIEAVPVEDVPTEDIPTEDVPAEDVPAEDEPVEAVSTPPPPAQGRSRSRSNRVK